MILRRTSPALMDGGFQVLSVEPDTLIYQRDSDDEIILVVAHRGESPRPAGYLSVVDAAIPEGTSFDELFTHQQILVENGTLPIPAMAQGAQVWVARNLSTR